MTGTVIVYGLLAIVFALGLSTLRALELWRVIIVPAALALAVIGFFVAGFGIGLLAWCLFATLTAITAIIVQHREFRGQARPVFYVFSSLAVSLILWPVLFPFLGHMDLARDSSGRFCSTNPLGLVHGLYL